MKSYFFFYSHLDLLLLYKAASTVKKIKKRTKKKITEPSDAKTDVAQKQRCSEQRKFLKRILQLCSWEQSDLIYQQYHGSGCVGTSVWNRGTFAACPRHTVSFTTLGADPEWRFYCSSRWPELCLVLNVFSECQTLTSVQRCLQLTAQDETADEQQFILSVGPPLWPLTDEMKESHPAWNRKGLHQHHISSSVCIKLKSKFKKKKKKNQFYTWFANPCAKF